MTGLEVSFILLLGVSLGSFITLASYRLPHGDNIVSKASRCTACDKPLAMRDLVPVLSWLVNRARCRYCAQSIHWRYPLIELITAAVFLLIYARYGFAWETAIFMLLAVMLLILCVADFEHYLIPDEVHVVLLPLGLLYQWYERAEWMEVAIGLGFGLFLGFSLRFGYRRLRKKEGLGWGDVKFFIVAGAWLSILTWVPFLFLSGLLGIVTAIVWRLLGRGAIFPFGPALAGALFLCVMFPEIPEGFWEMQRSIYQ